MKKFTAILLAILMLISLAACGDKDDNSGDAGTTAAILGRDAYDQVISKNDLTLVNVWATWCTPCVNELPELQRVEDEYKNVGVVGILFDGVDPTTLARDEATIDIAADIMSEKGATYTVVIPDEYIFSTYCASLMYFPTSFLVDGDGNIVGTPIVGANDFDSWCEYIDAALGK